MEWNGYRKEEFEIDGKQGFVVFPKKHEKNMRWVWRAEFFSAFDYVDNALIEMGWARAYFCVSDQFGSPEAVDAMKKFHDYVVEKYGLNKKADVFGFSRGGLYSVNYATKYPEDVMTLYLDAPVLSLASWPGMFGKTKMYRDAEQQSEWQKCKKVFGFEKDEDVFEYTDIPLNKAEDIVKNKIPVVLVAGDSDKLVDFSENGEIFANDLKRMGAELLLIVKEGVGHHPHSLEDPTPVVDFIKAHE